MFPPICIQPACKNIEVKIDKKGGMIFRGPDNSECPNNIAGIINSSKNVLGLMPHPERAIDLTKQDDGILFFKSLKMYL